MSSSDSLRARPTWSRFLRPWAALLVACLALPLAAQEGQPDEQPGGRFDGVERPPDTIDPAYLDVLLDEFGEIDGVETVGTGDDAWVVWTDAAGQGFEVIDESGGDMVVYTAIGSVLLDAWLLADGIEVDLRALIERFATARREVGAPTEAEIWIQASLTWTESFGATFGDEAVLLEVDGTRVFVAEELDGGRREPELVALQLEAGRAATRLGGLDLPEVARDAVAVVLNAIVPGYATGDPLDVGEVAAPTPVIRRLLRHGWLDRVAPGLDAEEVIESMLDAEVFAPTARFVCGDASITRYANAFDDMATVTIDGATRRLALPHAEPEYTDGVWTRLSDGYVELELAADVDPFGDAVFERCKNVVFRLWGRELFAWTPGESSRVGPKWAASTSIQDQIDHEHPLPDMLPPHVLLQTALGNRYGLLVPGGLLEAPRGADDAERFLDDAASLLPDAAHLDLIGQYLIDYTFDSPDPERPLLLGTESFCGDRQNTAQETIATACGGSCRGDCDDLAALYIELRARQAVLAVPMGTPGHLSALWVVPKGDEFAAQVLQTGLPLEFRGATVEEAVAALYRYENPSAAFDPQAAWVPLRLAGERRSMDVALPIDALVSRPYAADVRRRLELQHRGLHAAAERAAAASAQRFAEALEPRLALAGLRVVSDPGDAAERFRTLVADAAHPTTRARARGGLVLALARSGDLAGAHRALDRFLGVDLPAVARNESVLGRVGLVSELAYRLHRDADDELRRRLVDGVLLPELGVMVDGLISRWSDEGTSTRYRTADNDSLLTSALGAGLIAAEQVRFDPGAAHLRPELDAIVERYVRRGMAALEAADGLWWEELEWLGGWMAIADGQDVLSPDGPLPRWPGGGVGILLDQIDEATDADWRDRVARWVAIAPAYWGWRAWAETVEGQPRPEPGRLRALDERCAAVLELYPKVEVQDALTDLGAVLGRVRCLTILDDRARLAEVFRWLRVQDDPYMFQAARDQICDAARWIPPATLAALVELWGAETGYVRADFAFAWELVRLGLLDHALAVAEVATANAGRIDAEVRELGVDANWAAAERGAIGAAVERSRTR